MTDYLALAMEALREPDPHRAAPKKNTGYEINEINEKRGALGDLFRFFVFFRPRKPPLGRPAAGLFLFPPGFSRVP